MTQAATISFYQPLLQSIAYRMVGCIQDAEDIVQDTFVKYLSIEQETIQNTKAYLIRSVTNHCLNHLSALKNKNKVSLESVKLPDVLVKLDFSHLDLKQEMEAALSILHKKLGPLERGVFLLREVFDYEYDELQEIFNKKKDHCRQLVSRAKEKLAKETDRFQFHFDLDAYILAVKKATEDGQFDDLLNQIHAHCTRES